MPPSRPLGRAVTVIVSAATLGVVAAAQPAVQSTPAPAAMLKAARDAMGGDGKVLAIKGLRLTGTFWSSQTVVGGYTQDLEDPYELRIAMPDRFMEITVPFSGVTSALHEARRGFAGDRTITTFDGQSSMPPGQDTYLRKKAAELLLMVLLRTEPWGGLRFTTAGPHALQAAGLDGYAARLEFDPATGALARLVYHERRQIRPTNTIRRRGQAGGGNSSSRGSSSSGGRAGGSGISGDDLPAVEITVAVTDRREVNGVRLPHRLTTTAQGITLWEWRFETIQVNPAFSDRDFDGGQGQNRPMTR